MGNFILGVLITLAILYPAVTKEWFGKAVDTTNSVATSVIKENTK
jgi:hypothetical protein